MKQRYFQIMVIAPLTSTIRQLKYTLPLCAGVLSSGNTLAQLPPDAGQILQQSEPPVASPQPPSIQLNLQGQPLSEAVPGGQRISLNAVHLEGNSRFTTNELLQLVQDQISSPQDLAGIQSIANRISQYYRDNGYPFAQALIPAQSLADGVLELQVVEGRYGQVAATSDNPTLAAAASPWLSSLRTGTPIESAYLERRILLLGDLPGISITPIMRPGINQGEGDLEVQVRSRQRVTGSIGADNHGSRFSGEYRGRASLSAHHLATLGDELNLTSLYSNESTWLGDIRYSIPLGTHGMRGELNYTYTDYALGKGFEGYTGTADVYAAGIYYSLVRRQQSNVSLSARYLYKDLDDDIELFNYRRATSSHSVPLGIRFDHRDALGVGGITYGAVTLTPGTLSQTQTELEDADYGFTHITLDIARIQALGSGFELYGRTHAQWADLDNLDGSESFFLGGPYGVRAYPVGEGSDSRGWLAQLEARYHVGNGMVPYVFIDGGRTPSGGNDDNARSLSGAGVGLRYQQERVSLNVSSAWRLDGDDAQADDQQRDPTIWASANYHF
ncbi:ShlB/FhaC/HecB family hemolysin secretion/activation protein [Vreelandella olivaria]|uniref:ShlB/FhaC/HecB family hemolysin secretion/activation protein n=1 Tax=Vreelandella olivaria TaxID=390919 RepID=UPI00201F7340|nr:ShlB/FhaC/HecB family hemolysin secretion/activation protein [Halomonas olivaria]